MGRALFLKVPKLSIAVRRRSAFDFFHVHMQIIVMRLQQPTNHRATHAVTLGVQFFFEIREATIEPFTFTHRITRGMRSDQVQQRGFSGRVFFSESSRPPPSWRWRSKGTFRRSSSISWRPRRIVFSSIPVMSASCASRGLSRSCESTPTCQRLCSSARRPSKRLI
jgi:hypothetical protein